MKPTQFRALLDSLATLTPSQHKELVSALSPTAASAATSQPLDRRQPSECPHCSSELVVRKGIADGLQRYLCRSCSRTFNATTGTPLCGVRNKKQFEAFIDSVRKGVSVQAAATKVGVSKDTAARWYRRFLQSAVSKQ